MHGSWLLDDFRADASGACGLVFGPAVRRGRFPPFAPSEDISDAVVFRTSTPGGRGLSPAVCQKRLKSLASLSTGLPLASLSLHAMSSSHQSHQPAPLQDALRAVALKLRELIPLAIPRVDLSCPTPAPGDTVAVLICVPAPRTPVGELHAFLRREVFKQPLVRVEWDGADVPVYPTDASGRVWRALVGTTPLDAPGVKTVAVEVNDGRHRRAALPVTLQPRDFETQDVWLDGPLTPPTPHEAARVADLGATLSADRRWAARPLVAPVAGKITSAYGLRRRYNGVFAPGYFHAGVDFAAEEGTPVVAPAGGRVALVGRPGDGFDMHGCCVGVDHGQGVTSLFMHLSSAAVLEGDEIAAGQVLGEVGSTGRSTGPHLHFGLAVHGKSVDPMPWLSSMQDWKGTNENSLPPWAF